MTDTSSSPARQKTGRARTGEAGSVRTLERGLTVLTSLAELGQASLTQVAKAAGLSASTTYRLLETLRQGDFVEWEERSGLFSVGVRAYQVGAAFAGRNTLMGAAQAEMNALVNDLGETVNLAVLRGSEAVYIHQVEGRQLVRMFAQLGTGTPLNCSGVGKMLLAWHSDDDVAQRLGDQPYAAFTPNSITALEPYLQELRKVRAQGYALDDEEREIGVRCMATPLRDHTRQVVASLSVSSPTSRFDRAQIPAFYERMDAASRVISARLGWTP